VKAESSSLYHDPVVSAVQGVDVVVTARSPDQDVARGQVFFRQISEREYISQPMLRSDDRFEGRIPSRYVAGLGIEYYIVLSLADGTTITSPEQDPMFLPHVILILPAEQKWLEILFPEANSVIEKRMPQISAAFDPDAAIAADRIQVKLDNIDVTDECEVTQDFFLYIPSEELSPGTHLVTVASLDDPGMVSSWQFSIAGKPSLWRGLTGGASVTWQWSHSDSDSVFLIHDPGSSFGLSAQMAGLILGRSFDAWYNRSTLYKSKSSDFSLGFYGDKTRLNVGDLFPSISRLTLDGMPVRGGEMDIKPSGRARLYLIGGEGRLFDDLEDEFMAGLLNSRFGGVQMAIQPIKERWKINAMYIHARNYAETGSDVAFSMEKRNDIFSLRTELDMPADFTLHGEWARSEHLTRYDENFVSESCKDEGVSIGLEKRIKTVALESFYLNVGDDFLSEVNPFVESGREGFGLSGRYSHRKGLSVRGEYGRYRKESEVNTEARANVNLSLSKLPSISAVYYQHRVPYAKYDTRGVSLGSSYRFRKLDFSANGSYSITNLWTDNTERDSISASASAGYEVTKNTDLRLRYSQFRSRRSGNAFRKQWQSSAEVRRRVGKNHLFNATLKAANLTDEGNVESNYFEKVLLFKYGYSF
jgi:predicted porin